MKLRGGCTMTNDIALSVPSTSGLRDETSSPPPSACEVHCFQYPQPRVYAMKPVHAHEIRHPLLRFQYPQPRVYAMKLHGDAGGYPQGILSVPSTSGLRDETLPCRLAVLRQDILSVPSTSGLRDETYTRSTLYTAIARFQYPQPRVYAMKHPRGQRVGYSSASFSTLNLGSTR